ncbi:MAG: hypothetical protein HOE48_10380 [Candidatus Latescibacteria bacterium]|nr:hypothetical protein [Candidatus Latescibacterota bacterium]MBT4138315.1 hypothetical protein [Candidatus Latescibacterota bacterium]MBT5828647.1 hypothetical protein [Candidatus Latescibacterota bacterium]
MKQHMSKDKTFVFIGILLIFLFHATGVRDGHNWGGDFSQYILHAQQLVQGQPYADLGYVYSVKNPVGPRAYPPGFPLSLVPALYLFDLNFVALKITVAIFFALALWAYWRIAQNHLPRMWALGSLAFLALSPRMLKFGNNVLCDVPFLALTLICIYAIHQYLTSTPNWRTTLLVTVSFVLVCSFHTRGIILIGALGGFVLLFQRSHLRSTIVCTLVAILGASLIYQAAGSGGGNYLEHLSFHPIDLYHNFIKNIAAYKRGLLRYLSLYPSRNEDTLHFIIINNSVLLIFAGLFFRGVIHNLKNKGIQYHDVFVVAYLAVILLYRWNQSIRYLFPIIPILTLHTFVGLRLTAIFILRHTKWPKPFRLTHRLRPFAPASIYAPLFLMYWVYFVFYPTAPGANILLDTNTNTLFQTVREHKNDLSGIIFSHPRVMKLFTGARTAVCYNTFEVHWDIDQLLAFAQENEISHLAVGPYNYIFRPIVSKNSQHFQTIYQNDTFAIHRIQQAAMQAPTAATTSPKKP